MDDPAGIPDDMHNPYIKVSERLQRIGVGHCLRMVDDNRTSGDLGDRRVQRLSVVREQFELSPVR